MPIVILVGIDQSFPISPFSTLVEQSKKNNGTWLDPNMPLTYRYVVTVRTAWLWLEKQGMAREPKMPKSSAGDVIRMMVDKTG